MCDRSSLLITYHSLQITPVSSILYAMNCLLIGNFGVGNLGDEAFKEYFLTEFSDIDWTVVSAHPQGKNEVSRLPGGLRSLLNLRWIKTISAYKSCDAVVFGGGSLFTDTESVYACFLWSLHARLGFWLGKPVHFAFQGVGPFRTRTGARISHRVFRKAASISVRDSLSFKRVGEWGLGTKCVQSFDPVFSLIESQNIDVCSQNILILIPRKNSSGKFTNSAQEKIKSMHPDSVVILSMQPDKKSEIEFCQSLASSIKIPTRIQNTSTLSELLQEVSNAGFVISERYHGALAALALKKEVEVVSQSDGDKLSTLCQLKGDMIEQIDAGARHLRGALKN